MAKLPHKIARSSAQTAREQQQKAEADANFSKMLEESRQQWAEHQARMKGRGGK